MGHLFGVELQIYDTRCINPLEQTSSNGYVGMRNFLCHVFEEAGRRHFRSVKEFKIMIRT